MLIETSKGKTFEGVWAYGPMRGSNELMIELRDDRLLSQVAADFEGCETIRVDNGRRSPVMLYEGYTHLSAVDPGEDDGSYRLTLKKPKEG